MDTIRLRRCKDHLADHIAKRVERRGSRYVIELHPDEAARMGLLDGQEVHLEFIAAGWTRPDGFPW